jgi:hypothetical protein
MTTSRWWSEQSDEPAAVTGAHLQWLLGHVHFRYAPLSMRQTHYAHVPRIRTYVKDGKHSTVAARPATDRVGMMSLN